MSTAGSILFFFFFFMDPATPEIYPLPLPDALPISSIRDRFDRTRRCSVTTRIVGEMQILLLCCANTVRYYVSR